MKTLKCAFAGLRLVPFGASAMARQRYSRRQNEIIVSFAPAGSTETMARDALGFEAIADTVAHSAARLKAQPSKWAAMIDHTKFKSEMSCSNSRS